MADHDTPALPPNRPRSRADLQRFHRRYPGVTIRFTQAGSLEQRLGIENSVWMASFLKTLPLWAIAPCGVLFSHAAPAAELANLSELEAIDYRRYLSPKAEARSRTKAPKPGEATARLFGQLLWEQALPPFKAQALLGVAPLRPKRPLSREARLCQLHQGRQARTCVSIHDPGTHAGLQGTRHQRGIVVAGEHQHRPR